jgi:hypothetical protein
MKLPRVRFTIGRIMVAIAIVAVALVTMRSDAFTLRLRVTPPPPVTLPNGTIVLGRSTAEVNVTWLGVALVVAGLGTMFLAAAWVTKRLIRAAVTRARVR